MTTEELFLLTPDERQAWELCEKATPGPWRYMTWPDGYGCVLSKDHNRLPLESDLKFSANARTALPDALRTIAGLRAELAQVKAQGAHAAWLREDQRG